MAKVFIVHGHDHEGRDELVTLITGYGLKPIVFSKVPDFGKTIIEKFEHYAEQCEFAIILLTPDDKDASQLPSQQRFRARQNAIFEMGWFFAKLGRKRTLLVHKGSVELPTDVTGILYKKFRKSPLELSAAIRGALVAGGVRIQTKRK